MKTSLSFDHTHYVPCLRWKMGEYQAVLRLPTSTKNRMRPLIEVAEMGWDFEKRKMAKTVDDHVEDFSKNVSSKWGTAPVFIDLKHLSQFDRMASSQHPLTYIFDGLRSKHVCAIPVSGLVTSSAFQAAIKKVIQKDGLGLCLRVTLLQIQNKDFRSALATFLTTYQIAPSNIDFIFDLESPSFEPIDGFAKMIRVQLTQLPFLNEWRTLTILGTSFPSSMAQLSLGSQLVKRKEWLFYKELLRVLDPNFRRPTFGDYIIAHPALVPQDPRLIKPSATIRYATDDAWMVFKGKNLRDNGNGQYRTLCRDLMSKSVYSGPGFSAGDAFIEECAAGTRNPGNLSTWRWVGTNRHLQKIVSDLASLPS